MTEDMQAAWLEIEQMLGEATREEFDVFLRTWQRAVQATRKTLAQPDFWEGYVPEPVKPAQQEPVAYLCENAVGHKYFRWKKPSSTYKPIALYTSLPAQRTWVGLTDEEIDDIYQGAGKNDLKRARAIEAKLRSKNENQTGN